MDEQRGVADERQDPAGEAVQQCTGFRNFGCFPGLVPAEQPGAHPDQVAEPLVPVVRIAKVAEAKSPAADLVFVGRADAAPGGSDAAAGKPRLFLGLDSTVDRQDDLRPVGEHQIAGRIEAGSLEFRHLVEKRPGVHDAPRCRRWSGPLRGAPRKEGDEG